MGIQQSKGELLYQQVNYGNVEGIKTLRSEGAGLEWIDKEGKTPLIVACMNPELYNVARALIELGANVNAYRPGRHAGTPLHHAAKRGLDQTVKLLLLHGANALVINDNCQTPLDVARVNSFSNVVRAIEAHICLFSGWLKELYGPSFLEILAPKFLSRKVWVVVIPCGSRNLRKPFRLELAIYTNVQDAQPRTIVALWKANMEEPNFNQPEPAVIISDTSTIPRRWRRRRGITYNQVRRQTRLKIAALSETEKQRLQWFCDACKGIPQVAHPTFPFNTQGPVCHATAPPNAEDVELAMAIDASLQSSSRVNSDVATSSDSNNPVKISSEKANTSGHDVPETSSSGVTSQHIEPQIVMENPSAPPAVDDIIYDGPIHYPTIDDAPIDLCSTSAVVSSDAKSVERKDSVSSSSCIICLDAPVEGACIPCGHMAGCMSCLKEIKAKDWGCPVCRGKIDQVVRLYAV